MQNYRIGLAVLFRGAAELAVRHVTIWHKVCQSGHYYRESSAKPKEPQWTMRTRAVDPRRLISPSSAAPTTGQKLSDTTCAAAASQHYLPVCAHTSWFTAAPAAAGHARGRSWSVLAALASPRCAGAV